MSVSVDKPWQRIQWAKAPPVRRDRLTNVFVRSLSALRNLFFAEEAIPSDLLRATIQQCGIPHVPGATPLEEARILLAAGGEVEHALLVQYLYAAWSSPAQSTIVDIAIQEMQHFITVQNLLLFLGGNPRMQRQDQDPTPELDPFAFTLRPFSQSVLEDFLLTEMPLAGNMTSPQRTVMQPIIDRRIQTGQGVHPVGCIYAALYWLLQPDDSPTQDWPAVAGSDYNFERGRHIASFPGQGAATTFEADPLAETAWDRGHGRDGVFENIGSRDQALRAIYEIAAQGEGPVADAAGLPSHFSTFFDLYQNTDFNTLPSSNWPTDPFVSDAPANDPAREANRITNPLAAALSRLLDLRYRIALTCIRAALSRDRSNAQDLATRTKYIKWLFGEMKGNVRPLVFGLARLPRKTGAGAGPLVAGPTFNLDGFQLPDTPTELDTTLFSLHQDAARAITAALAQPVDISLKSTLGQMLQNDKLRYPNLMA
jgi:hypothetical protein